VRHVHGGPDEIGRAADRLADGEAPMDDDLEV
jgi:hypothetical protein